jgi:RNA polymerase sigma-70 factor (ECF subfamily)
LRVLTLSDREISPAILESCRSGERDAFRALYDWYKDRVYSIALYFFHGDHAVAADVTQEVFLKLMQNIAQFRGDSGFSTWLYRLVVNVCMDTARRRKTVSALPDASAWAALPAAQEEDYARAQMSASVRAAVSELPPKFRIAVLLRYFEGLSYGEMARTLHCSLGTVASRLSRGHRMLGERLKDLVRPKS